MQGVKCRISAFSFIRTIPSVTEFHRISRFSTARGLYHRWGIAPRPENFIDFIIILAFDLSIKI